MNPANLSTAAAGVVAFVCLVLQWTVGKQKVKPLAVFLAVAFGAGLIEGTIGPWLRRKLAVVTDAALDAVQTSITDAEISQIIAVVASVIMICIGLVVLGFAIAYAIQKKITTKTLPLFMAAPVAANLFPGGIAAALSGIMSFAPHAVGGFVAWGLGG